MAKAEQRSPFAPAPLQGLQRYYGLLRPYAALRYSRPRGFSRLWLLPWHRNAGSHVPYLSLVELRAAYTPDAPRAVSGHLPSSSRRKVHPPSRPREFHPEPLTDPDLILSHHPARVLARRLPPSAKASGSSQYDPVGPCLTAKTRPLRSTSITPASTLLRGSPPLAGASVLSASWLEPLAPF